MKCLSKPDDMTLTKRQIVELCASNNNIIEMFNAFMGQVKMLRVTHIYLKINSCIPGTIVFGTPKECRLARRRNAFNNDVVQCGAISTSNMFTKSHGLRARGQHICQKLYFNKNGKFHQTQYKSFFLHSVTQDLMWFYSGIVWFL